MATPQPTGGATSYSEPEKPRAREEVLGVLQAIYSRLNESAAKVPGVQAGASTLQRGGEALREWSKAPASRDVQKSRQAFSRLYDFFVPQDAVGVVLSAIPPARPFRRYFHGTPHTESVLREGFTRGESSELRIPGTSVSRDPLTSAQFSGGSMGNIAVVDIPPEVLEKVVNLSPSGYMRKQAIRESSPNISGFRQPNLPYSESETAIQRAHPVDPTGQYELIRPTDTMKPRRLTQEEHAALVKYRQEDEQLTYKIDDIANKSGLARATLDDVREIRDQGGSTTIRHSFPSYNDVRGVALAALKSPPSSRWGHLESLQDNLIAVISDLPQRHPARLKFVEMQYDVQDLVTQKNAFLTDISRTRKIFDKANSQIVIWSVDSAWPNTIKLTYQDPNRMLPDTVSMNRFLLPGYSEGDLVSAKDAADVVAKQLDKQYSDLVARYNRTVKKIERPE